MTSKNKLLKILTPLILILLIFFGGPYLFWWGLFLLFIYLVYALASPLKRVLNKAFTDSKKDAPSFQGSAEDTNRFLNKEGRDFSKFLVITAGVLQWSGMLSLIFLIIMIGWGFFSWYLDRENWNILVSIVYIGFIPWISILAYVSFRTSQGLLKRTKLDYYLAFLVSIPYIFILTGLFVIWFLLTYRSEYFSITADQN